MPSALERQAIAIARRYLENRGYAVENVSRSPKRDGYDLIGRRLVNYLERNNRAFVGMEDDARREI